MAERYPGDAAAANGFGSRHLREDEARLLYEADYPAPPDMRVPGSWRLSAGGVPVPPVPTGAERHAEIVRIRSSLTSSSSGSGSPAPRPVKPEPRETPLGRRTRSGESARPSPRSLRLVRPKTEPGLLPVKKEHAEMAADDETALKWAKEDYVRLQVERQRRAYEEIKSRRRGRDEGGIVVLDSDDDEDAPGTSNPPRVGDPGQGCSRDGAGGSQQCGGGSDDDDDGGGDYTRFYRLLGM